MKQKVKGRKNKLHFTSYKEIFKDISQKNIMPLEH